MTIHFSRILTILATLALFASTTIAQQPNEPAPQQPASAVGMPDPAPAQVPDFDRSLAEDPFLDAVDLSPLEKIAVFHGGRLKSYESFSSEMVSYVVGRNRIGDRPHSLTYLDMLFRPERYYFNPVVYVKKDVIRARFVTALKADAEMIAGQPDLFPGAERLSVEERRIWLDTQLENFMDTGLISERLLATGAGRAMINELSRDLIRTAKSANRIRNALGIKDPRNLISMLRIIPPAEGVKDQPWFSTDELYGASASQEIDLDPRTFANLRSSWDALTVNWQRGNAAGVNSALEQLATVLPNIAPELYPEQSRLSWETWYFKTYHMTWVWLIYLASMVFLLLSVVYKWPAARWLGLGTFSVAFLLHTFAVGLRWYIAGRWPNSNMFEAVTTSVWFGGAVALAIEVFARKSSMRNFFALTAAAAGMTAMMAAHYLPQLDPSINNMMPILHDLWLYIHTNVIIASYALIFMAAVPSVIYIARRIAGGSPDFARVGGAATFLDEATKTPRKDTKARSLGEVCDGVTMVLIELSFVLLWAGIIMGAIWADHSWGRPWGWDPKEVFALNTFLVFLVLIHVRLKARDKGLWTAFLAIAGAAVMLFNWIVINFVITGLHSYA